MTLLRDTGREHQKGPSELKISVIGLGKLGSPMAAVFADRGHTVIGVDHLATVVSAINEGKAPVWEPGLQALVDANRESLTATTDLEAAVLGSEITFIIVPTPSEPDGRFSMRNVLVAAETMGKALQKKGSYHLVVVTSTVMPEDTGSQVLPILEAASGLKCGQDFGLCYSPEFIALGSVISDLLKPDFYLIGESDPRAGDLLYSFYRSICDNDPPVERMNFVNAELAKLAINTYVTTKITYANTLARLCEKIPGADADVVTGALGRDSRIGGKYLKGALGYGGPCFTRDNVAFAKVARQFDLPALLAEATDEFNRMQVSWIVDDLVKGLPTGGTVGVLGLSYKPNTDVVEESQGLSIGRELARRGVKVVVYDPAAMDNAFLVLKEEVGYAASAEECARTADTLIITTPWDEFSNLSPEIFDADRPRPRIVDCWRILDSAAFSSSAHYMVMGKRPTVDRARIDPTPDRK